MIIRFEARSRITQDELNRMPYAGRCTQGLYRSERTGSLCQLIFLEFIRNVERSMIADFVGRGPEVVIIRPLHKPPTVRAFIVERCLTPDCMWVDHTPAYTLAQIWCNENI